MIDITILREHKYRFFVRCDFVLSYEWVNKKRRKISPLKMKKE